MTHQRLGNKDRARYWYDDACEQQAKFAALDKHKNTGMLQEVERLRDEAAELLGIGKN